MGSGLQLAVAAALVTGSALFIAEQSQPAVHCPPGPSWRQQASLLAGMPAEEAAGLDSTALSTVTGVAADAMRRVGWSPSTKFARFGKQGSNWGRGVPARPLPGCAPRPSGAYCLPSAAGAVCSCTPPTTGLTSLWLLPVRAAAPPLHLQTPLPA